MCTAGWKHLPQEFLCVIVGGCAARSRRDNHPADDLDAPWCVFAGTFQECSIQHQQRRADRVLIVYHTTTKNYLFQLRRAEGVQGWYNPL